MAAEVGVVQNGVVCKDVGRRNASVEVVQRGRMAWG